MCRGENKPVDRELPRIVIQFVGQDSYTINFRVKYTTPLHRIGRRFAEMADLSIYGIRLIYDGHRVDPNATPQSLGLCENEIIEVYQEQLSG